MSQLTKIERPILQASEATVFSLNVVRTVHEARRAHGLWHKDYLGYRQYCSRRIRRIRKRFDLRQGGRKFIRRDLHADNLRNEGLLELPLLQAERAWAYAMQLKEEARSDPRKKYAFRNKLRKAAEFAETFQLLVEKSGRCDARTKLCVEGYAAWLQGTACYELADWTLAWDGPLPFFDTAIRIYTSLLDTVTDEEREMISQLLNEMKVQTRFCRHRLGDAAATSSLLSMPESTALDDRLQDLLAQARGLQAETLTEVTWKGRTLPVRQSKVRHFLLKEAQAKEGGAEALDGLLMECRDALALVREDCTQEPSFKSRQLASQGPVSSIHFLHTYLCYLKAGLTVRRNLALLERHTATLAGAKQLPPGAKVPRDADVVRLYDLSIAALEECPQLAGLEGDHALRDDTKQRTMAFRAVRCYYVANTYARQDKWTEAMVLYERAEQRAKEVESSEQVSESDRGRVREMLRLLEGTRATAKAEVLQSLKAKDATPKPSAAPTSKKAKKQLQLAAARDRKVLADRLEEYSEDSSLLSHNTATIVSLQPPLQPLPSKPLFFDVALNHVAFPSLKHKLPANVAKPEEAQQASGLSGLVNNLFSWGSKK